MPDWHALAAILAVGAVCYAMRAGGFLAASAMPAGGLLARLLRLAPGNLFVAFAAAGMLQGGWPSLIGCAAAVATMAVTRREWAAWVPASARGARRRAAVIEGRPRRAHSRISTTHRRRSPAAREARFGWNKPCPKCDSTSSALRLGFCRPLAWGAASWGTTRRAISSAMGRGRRIRAGPAMRASPSTSSSITRRAPNTASSTATTGPRPSSPSGCGPAGPGLARPQHGIHVRVRRPGRGLARAAPLRGARRDADRLCRRPGAGAQSRGRRGHRRGGLAMSSPMAGAGSTMRAIPEADEREHIRRCIEVIARLTGERPLGWYSGRPSLNTRRLVVEEGGFLYDGDAYADDLPYLDRGRRARHLIVPHTFDNNDSRMARNRISPSTIISSSTARRLRRALSRRRGRPEDDDRQPALPAHRPAGTDRRAAALHRSCAGP